jgi:hypothetical protein
MHSTTWRQGSGERMLRTMAGILVCGLCRESRMQLLDTVALLGDVTGRSMYSKDVQLFSGQVGTVVDDAHPHFVLVEFVAEDGATYALVSVPRSNLLRLRRGSAGSHD